jgi:hypothetical protein
VCHPSRKCIRTLKKTVYHNMTLKHWDRIRLAVILFGATPLLFFLHASWVRSALLGYLLTALLFGFVLVPTYPPLNTAWFWKAMIPITVFHSAIIFGLVWLDLKIPEVNKMPRALYGFAAIILVIEWRIAVRIIDALQPAKSTGAGPTFRRSPEAGHRPQP